MIMILILLLITQQMWGDFWQFSGRRSAATSYGGTENHRSENGKEKREKRRLKVEKSKE